eukprot:TRINITY_DN56809_c0_g1_i1.p1 TRINITY_DN56809_c0_g1~~TRINITY_DN56809_c0_g1_i1.p1  ORF type:complete len:506 (+),score=155.60 TRINITY_DN56809_c0_g1_i1:152-1669(+)
MADVDRTSEDGGSEEIDEAERAEKLNPELLTACMKNDTEAAIRLIEQQADPCCEDSKQWSPLIWAASHGNDTLTRLLIKHDAAEVYKYDESAGKAHKKKHSPLHWAAFKDHVHVLWLLMAPPLSLSHHERDTIGNTALHQAAAGGSLECAKCLMAMGCDVLAKNDRGHIPSDLCTVASVQALLQQAINTTACKASGKQFSSTVLRFMCSWSLDFFCEAAVTQTYVYESPDATEKEKPVTWCTEVKNTIMEAENQLSHAMHMHIGGNQLEAVTAALEFAEDKDVDCKLVFQCRQIKAKLEAEIELGKAMKTQIVESLEEFGVIHEALTAAVEDAEAKGADPKRVDAARALRRKLMAEASLMRVVQGPQKTTVGHITTLEELHAAAEGEGANEALLGVAKKLIAKLKSERETQHRIAAAAPLCELNSFKEAEGKEGLPEWSKDTETFETFHEEYKEVVEGGEVAEISSELMATALEQLAKIEHLLIERKQIEEEMRLKAAKKKKGKK